ncbi:hypothetical protein diail_4813 [Diaporthe ilicicola]|nr:hypothetical protein diail_4813 [Diaporthe ilicicola]
MSRTARQAKIEPHFIITTIYINNHSENTSAVAIKTPVVAMMLCQNRQEDISFLLGASPGLPSQCFFDTILVPLPTWVFILALPVVGLIRTRVPATQVLHGTVHRAWVRRATLGLYYFCVFAIVLMESIEIGRLAAADMGVGLLPFVYVACALAVVTCAADAQIAAVLGWERGWWQEPTALFCVMSGIISTIKTIAVEALDGARRLNTPYPVSDQFTDLVVLSVLYFVLLLVVVAMKYFVRPTTVPAKRGSMASDGEAVELTLKV